MTEFGRLAQEDRLRSVGWYIDDECSALQSADESVGGPTYMKDPHGLMYEVSCGKETLLDGVYSTGYKYYRISHGVIISEGGPWPLVSPNP